MEPILRDDLGYQVIKDDSLSLQGLQRLLLTRPLLKVVHIYAHNCVAVNESILYLPQTESRFDSNEPFTPNLMEGLIAQIRQEKLQANWEPRLWLVHMNACSTYNWNLYGNTGKPLFQVWAELFGAQWFVTNRGYMYKDSLEYTRASYRRMDFEHPDYALDTTVPILEAEAARNRKVLQSCTPEQAFQHVWVNSRATDSYLATHPVTYYNPKAWDTFYGFI